MKWSTPWIAGIVLSAFSAAAVAGAGYSNSGASGASSYETPRSGESVAGVPSFAEADRNGDGAIDWSEASDVPGLNLTAADTDTDGVVTMGEYNSAVDPSRS